MNQNRYNILKDIIGTQYKIQLVKRGTVVMPLLTNLGTKKYIRTYKDHCGNVCYAMYCPQKRRTYPYSLPELVCYTLGIDMMGTKIRKNFIKDKVKPRLRELIAKGEIRNV